MTSKFATLIMENGLRGFISRVLANNTQSEIVQYLKFYMANLQYFVIVIWGQAFLLSNAKRDFFSSFTLRILQFLFIKDLFTEYPQTYIYIVFLALTWAYLFFVLFGLIYVSIRYVYELGSMEFYYRSLYKVMRFHFTVVFWMLNMVLMTAISREPKNEVLYWTSTNQSQSIRAINIILVLFNYFLGVCSALLCFAPLPENKIFAAHSTSCQFVIFFFKAIIAPVLGFLDTEALITRIIFVVAAFLISTLRLIVLLKVFPYYYPIAMKLSGIMAATGAWLSFVNIPIIFFNKESMNFTTILYIDFLILPIAIKFTLVHLSRATDYFITVDPQTLNSEEQVFKKLYTFGILSEDLKFNTVGPPNAQENYFYGQFVSHIKTCLDLKCPCRYLIKESKHISKGDTKERRKNFLRYQYLSLYQFFSTALLNIKDNDNLKITLAHLIFKYQDQGIVTALTYLFSTSSRLAFFIRIKKNIVTLNVQDYISKYFTERRNNALNMKDFIDFHHSKTHFMELLLSNTDKYIKFWETYKNSDVKLKDVLRKSIHLEKEASQIEKIWSNHFQKYDEFCTLLKEPYCAYLNLVRNMPAASQNIMKKLVWKSIKKLNDEPSIDPIEEDFYSSDIMNVYITMAKERLGRIIYASKNLIDKLGFIPEEVKNAPIDCLQPHCIAEKHPSILSRYLDKSRASQANDYLALVSFVKTKKGHLVPCSFYVSIFPYVQNELIFVSTVKVVHSKYEIILFNSKGLVDGFSEKVGQVLNLSVNKKYHVSEICLDVHNLHATIDYDIKKLTNQDSKQRTAESKVLPIDVRINSEEEPIKKKEIFHRLNEALEHTYDENSSFVVTFIKQPDTNKSNTTPINNANAVIYCKYRVKIVESIVFDIKIHTIVMEPYTIQDIDNNHDAVEKVADQNVDQIQVDESAFDEKSSLIPSNMSTFEQRVNESIGDDLPLFNTLALGQKGQMDCVFIPNNTTQERDQFTTNAFETLEDKFLLNPLRTDQREEASMLDSKVLDYKLDQCRAKPYYMKDPSSKDVETPKIDGQKSDKQFSIANSNTSDTKIERAVYSLTRSKTKNVIQNSAIALLLTCLVLHLIFYFSKVKNIEQIKGNTDILVSSHLRLYQLAEMNRRARIISITLDGYSADDRYSPYGVSSAVESSLSSMLNIETSLLTYNNLIRDSLYKIKGKLQSQFYNNQIPVRQGSPTTVTRYSQAFNLITDIAATTRNLYETPSASLTAKDPNLLMILDNTINELFVDGEQVNRIIANDNQLKLQYLKTLIIYFLIVVLVVAIGVLLFYFNEASRVRLMRNKLIEIFLRLSNQEIDRSLQDVRWFKILLSRESSDFKSLAPKKTINTIEYNHKKDSSTRGFKLRKKNADMKGVNNNLIIACILATLFSLVCLTPFISEFILIDIQSGTLNSKIDTIVQFDTSAYLLPLITATFYEDLQTNGASIVRTLPINMEWEYTYKELLGLSDYLRKLTNQAINNKESSSSQYLAELLTGNLCNQNLNLGLSSSSCLLLDNSLTNGILGANDYILTTLRQAKDNFDSSDKSLNITQNILTLKALSIIDLIEDSFIPVVYSEANNILLRFMSQEVTQITNIQSPLLAIYIISTLIFGLLIFNYVWKITEEERIEWKKILRKVPSSILVTNKILKNYLVRESGLINNVDA